MAAPAKATDNTTFDDLNVGNNMEAIIGDPYKQIHRSLVTVEEYLARPYSYATYTWTTASTAGSFNPYAALSSYTVWQEKLKHFTIFRATAHVRVTLSGSPYHYGRLILNWRPNANTYPKINSAYSSIVGMSCLPHVLIDPSSTAAVELTVPFIYPLPAIQLNGKHSATALSDLAICRYVPFVTLGSSNTLTPENVIVRFWVYFTDVQLGGNTPSTVIVTSKPTKRIPLMTPAKEARKGTVENVSSAIASAAGMFTDIPVIGPIAKAVNIGAGGLSQIAALFGFSKPVETNPATVIALSNANFSTAIGVDNSQRLVADPNQQLEVCGQSLGFTAQDEMSFPYIASQWGYIGAMQWTTAQATGTVLGSILVNPGICGPVVTGTYRVTTPIGQLAMAHSNWSGKLEYRVIVVTSPMMRGRLSIRHIPYATSTATPAGFGGVDSTACVIELGNTTTMDITVPWTANDLSLACAPNIISAAGNVAGRASVSNSNGFLVFEVMSPLTANLAGLSTYILIYARGGDDLTFYKPDFGPWTALGTTGVVLTSRDGGIDKPTAEPPPCIVGTETFSTSDTPMLVHGEVIPSVRSILKRSQLTVTADLDSALAPASSGYVSIPIFVHPPRTGVTIGGAYSYFHLNMFNYFAHSYLGVRGSGRWKILSSAASKDPTGSMQLATKFFIFRESTLSSVVGSWGGGIPLTNANYPLPFSPGLTMTWADNSHNTVEFEIPYTISNTYLPSLTSSGAYVGTEVLDSAYVGVYTTNDGDVNNLNFYWSAGEDFNFLGYNGPSAYDYTF